ncbi:SBBP repeat-containing protein [Polyangium fumosum]|nr:SBBP repeat-containing protein [Polyangium fumosum]
MQMGTALDDELSGMALGPDASIYYTGYEAGLVGVTNIMPAGNARMVTARLDASGNAAWVRHVDTAGTDTGESVVLHPSSGAVVTLGRTTSDMPGFVNNGQQDIAVVVHDSIHGDVISAYQTGTERPQHPRRAAFVDDHTMVVAGYDDIFVKQNAVLDWENSLMGSFHVAEEGNVESSSVFYSDSIYSDYLLDVASDGIGAFFVGSVKGGSPKGTFVERMNLDSTVEWRLMLSTISVDQMTAVGISPTKELYAVGATFLKLGQKTFGQQDVILAKIDKTDGGIAWIAQVGTSESDWPTSVGFDAQGRIYVSGVTLGSFEGYQIQGAEDLFALRFDPNGNLEAVWQGGTPAEDNVSAMVVDACGNVVLGGYTVGAIGAGQEPLGGRDMFLLHVDGWLDVPR